VLATLLATDRRKRGRECRCRSCRPPASLFSLVPWGGRSKGPPVPVCLGEMKGGAVRIGSGIVASSWGVQVGAAGSWGGGKLELLVVGDRAMQNNQCANHRPTSSPSSFVAARSVVVRERHGPQRTFEHLSPPPFTQISS
jgi:hypothetical protein